MKTKFSRQLPPPQSLTIKSLRIHSIAGKWTEESVSIELLHLFMSVFFHRPGVGKGDGSDLKVKIIVKGELVFQCVCAQQENCTVRLANSFGFVSFLFSWAVDFSSFWPGISWCGQQCSRHQPAERACGWRGCEGYVWVECCECFCIFPEVKKKEEESPQ